MAILTKRWFQGTILLFSILGAIALVVYVNWDKQYPQATITMLNQVEGEWYSARLMNYEIITDVSFAEEKRRHIVSVKDGVIESAAVSYWDATRRTWGEPGPLATETASWFTIPGLFQTIRDEMQNNLREEIRVDIRGEPPSPQKIILGPVAQGGSFVAGTEVRILVRDFRPAQSER